MNHEKVEDNVYYAKEYDRFFQVRVIHDDYILCGGFREYYNDAKIDRREQKLSWKFLEDCVKVENLDDHPELWNYDGFGWKGRERPKVE